MKPFSANLINGGVLSMSSPEMKRTKNPKPQPISVLSLPDELLLSCIARVSRLYYRTLSLVCKRFESIVASPELYKFRSFSGLTESCLYVCVSYIRNRKHRIRWLTLCRKPDGGYVLVTVSIPDSPPAQFLGLVAVGSHIYNIAGSVEDDFRSSSVSILDCKSHTWREGPSFPVKLFRRTTGVVDENVYVAGIYGDDIPRMEYTFQVLDTKTQVWIPKLIPESIDVNTSACIIDGKFHVKISENKVIAYNSTEGKWEVAGKGMGDNMRLECYCVIGNVLFSAFEGVLRWYDTKIGMWKKVKGLGGLPMFLLTDPKACECIQLADHGGKMAVLWVEDLRVPGRSKKIISFVEIALKRWECGEMWGTVEWVHHQFDGVPQSGHIVKALAVTL